MRTLLKLLALLLLLAVAAAGAAWWWTTQPLSLAADKVEISVPQGAGYEMFVGSVSRDLPYVRGRVAGAPERKP